MHDNIKKLKDKLYARACVPGQVKTFPDICRISYLTFKPFLPALRLLICGRIM